MVEVDPTSAVVGAAGEVPVPLIDTFQEPVAAVALGPVGGSAYVAVFRWTG